MTALYGTVGVDGQQQMVGKRFQSLDIDRGHDVCCIIKENKTIPALILKVMYEDSLK